MCHDYSGYNDIVLQKEVEGMMYYFVISGMFACSCSQILLKNSANRQHTSFIASMLNWRVILAYIIFLGAMMINITAMSHGMNLKELPILEASSYLFVPLLSLLILKERIGLRELGAMGLIISGIIVFYV